MESIVREDKIHFYEYMEVEILHNYIRTGIQYALNSLLSSHPKLIPFRYYAPDIATLLKAIKDFYFLIRHQGLYAENFYGLQRTNPCKKSTAIIHVFLWVILPHILRKIQQAFISWKEEIEGSENGSRFSIFKRVFVKIYPFIYAIVNITQVYLKFRYLILPKSQYYSLEYYLTKTVTKYQESQEQQYKYPIFELLKSPGLFLILISHKIAGYFFSNNNRKQQRIVNNSKQIQNPVQIKQKKSKQCPICGRMPKNRAVLMTSGYIFCYSCISQYIRSQGKCPVTSIKSTDESIQIIYE